jgi:hypothetical protein
MVLPDGHSLVSTYDGLRFLGPNMTKVRDGEVDPRLWPADAAHQRQGRAGDGRAPHVWRERSGCAARRHLGDPHPAGQRVARFGGRLAQQVFVSTADAFFTFDANTLGQVERFDWVGGGRNPPVIGPGGQVYAIASNILFVFPAPRQVPANLVAQPLVDAVETQPTSQATSQLYHPPLLPDGNRLFACLELDGDDCGKGDYNQVSLAWCQKQGFTKVSGYDVDSRKVKAETLDAHFCSKNKCKVFDSIGCEN